MRTSKLRNGLAGQDQSIGKLDRVLAVAQDNLDLSRSGFGMQLFHFNLL